MLGHKLQLYLLIDRQVPHVQAIVGASIRPQFLVQDDDPLHNKGVMESAAGSHTEFPLGYKPTWWAPIPVRRSRFLPFSPRWEELNVEVAMDRVPVRAFSGRAISEVLYFDYQTQLDGNYPGRHGSGRSGMYRGWYLKGVGITPALANWNDPGERYHGSGHLPISSALREYGITRYLASRGLQHTIVPCETLLLANMTREQRRQNACGLTSSQPLTTPADARMMALSVKPADHARISNIVWALDHISLKPEAVGSLFLHVDWYLRSPDERKRVEGDPRQLVRAINRAFRRGWSNFESFHSAGLFWRFTQNNFTLDGRFVDLETPLLVGSPMVGMIDAEAGSPREWLGFEDLSFAWHWRLTVLWLKTKLGMLINSGVIWSSDVATYLRELLRELNREFDRKHLLLRDEELLRRTILRHSRALSLTAKARAQIRDLTEAVLRETMTGRAVRTSTHSWVPVPTRLRSLRGTQLHLRVPKFLPQPDTSEGEALADLLAKYGRYTDRKQLISSLSSDKAFEAIGSNLRRCDPTGKDPGRP